MKARLIKLTHNDTPECVDLTIGEVYDIRKRLNILKMVEVIDDAGDVNYLYDDEYEVIE